MVALEEALNTTIDEGAFSNAATVADLERVATAPAAREVCAEFVDFPSWNRSLPIRALPRVDSTRLPASTDARVRVDQGRRPASSERRRRPCDLRRESSNHMTCPSSLPHFWQMAAACRAGNGKEFFKATFFPSSTRAGSASSEAGVSPVGRVFLTHSLCRNGKAGARHTLRYAGELTATVSRF